MAEPKLLLKIVTPQGVVAEASVSSITAPGSDGEVGILPLHTQYTALAGVGVLRYTESDSGKTVAGVVSGGFLSVSGETATVLTESFDTVESIDRASYDAERSGLLSVVQSQDTRSAEWAHAREKLQRLEAIDSLIGVH